MAKARKSVSNKTSFNIIVLALCLFIIVLGVLALKTTSYFGYQPKASEQLSDNNLDFNYCMMPCIDSQDCSGNIPGYSCQPDPNGSNPGLRYCMRTDRPRDIYCGEALGCKIAVDPNLSMTRTGCGYDTYRSVTFKCCPTCQAQTITDADWCYEKSRMLNKVFTTCAEQGHKCYEKGNNINLPTQPVNPVR